MWPFNNLHITWELPWSEPEPENCDASADWVTERYKGKDPHYKVMGVIKSHKKIKGWWKTIREWVAHTEIWVWKKGKKRPEPVGESLFCIYFRSKSKIYLIQKYDLQTKRPVDLPSDEEQRVRLAVIKSKNKWRWF